MERVNKSNLIEKINEPSLSSVADSMRRFIVDDIQEQMDKAAEAECYVQVNYLPEVLWNYCDWKARRMDENGCELYLLKCGVSQNELDEAKVSNVEIARRRLYKELDYICALVEEAYPDEF